MPYLVAFLAAACVVLWATPVVKAVGIRSGQLDFPDERKIHRQPMVRLGGGFHLFWQLGGPAVALGSRSFWGLAHRAGVRDLGGDDRWGFVFF